MSSDDRPFITLPADQPDYETLSGLTLEQKAALPARFHTPDWLDTTPGAFVCRVCWDDGEVTGWPCASALAGRDRVFADPVDTSAREVPSEDQPKPRVWHKGDDEPVDKPIVTDNEGKRWEWRAQGDKPILSHANQWHCLDDTGHVWWEALVTCYGPLSEVLADSEQVTR